MIIPTKVVALGPNKAQIAAIHPEQPGRDGDDGWLRNTAGKVTWMPHPSSRGGPCARSWPAVRVGWDGMGQEGTARGSKPGEQGLLSQQHSCSSPPAIPTWDRGRTPHLPPSIPGAPKLNTARATTNKSVPISRWQREFPRPARQKG